MPSDDTGRDIFAEIAARRDERRAESLVTPEPPRLPRRFLPMAGGAAAEPWRRAPKVDTPEKLARELARQRRLHKRYLSDLAPALESARIVVPVSEFDWRLATPADEVDFNHTLSGRGRWQRVAVPHYGPPLGRAAAWYRATFAVSAGMLAKGALWVKFGGVDYKAHVFVNGSYLGSHEGLFAPFEFEFTPHARAGENVLLVKVENDAICMGNASWGADGAEFEGGKIYAATGPGYDEPEVGWHHCPPGMGIYQGVSIEARSVLHIRDLFLRPVLAEGRAEAWVEVWNSRKYRRAARVALSVFGQNFRATVVRDREYALPGEVGPGVNYLRFSFDIKRPRLWDTATPWLYQAQARLMDARGAPLDAASRQFGMRSFEVDEASRPKGRILLNGRPIRLRGANTMGFEQQCVMTGDWDRLRDDILLAKACNMNFLRLTQRPVQPEVYDWCDRLGLMTQTDLPLFGVLRRNQFAEAVRQAGEMERLIRSHPSNILVSYINEPFPGAGGRPWRHLTRPGLESFFSAATAAVRVENPDRAVKPVDGDYDPPAEGLPDNHCYCGWYNGHGVDLGRLHKGYWQGVKPGWLYGCGEFGAEGLDTADLMRGRYPAAWLPQAAEDEAAWTPERIPQAQTGRFHYMWFDTQHTVEDWSRAGRAHQAWATRLMTEAFRRDARMVSTAIHLFIDAFPSGWMKAIMDVERAPKPAYFAYRDCLTPLAVNLRADQVAYFSGEGICAEAWICNDTDAAPRGASLRYRLELGGRAVAAGTCAARVPASSSAFQGFIRCKAPSVASRARATLRLAIVGAGGKALHDTAVQFDVFPALAPAAGRAYVIGGRGGKAARLAREIGLAVAYTGAILPTDAVLIDAFDLFTKREREISTAVRAGARATFVELPPGNYSIAGAAVEAAPCGMNPVHFVSRATGHPMVADFAPEDFRFWYDASLGHPTPILSAPFTAAGWRAILVTGKGGWRGGWTPALAAAELPDGAGAWRISQVHLSGRLAGNPVAAIFARRLAGVER